MYKLSLTLTAAVLWCTVASLASAAPPSIGTTNYAFEDPVFNATVFCDTLDQVKEIAAAPDPNEVFKKYFELKNVKDEPTCAATTFYADILDVQAIPDMHQAGNAFHAWAVKIGHNNLTAWALYLENFKEVQS